MSSTPPAGSQPTIQLKEARSRHQEGKLQDALEIYRQLLTADPDCFEALYGMGILCGQMGRLEEALSFITRAADIQPDNAGVHYNRGKVFQDLRRHDEALASYDKALLLKPDHVPAHYNRAHILNDLRRYAEALAGYDKVLELKPDLAEAHNNRGNVLRDMRRYDEALAGYDEAIALKPGYAEAYSNRGNVLKDLQRYDEALASYGKAISLNPGYAAAYNNRGTVLEWLQRYDEALASYGKAISLNPDYAAACNNQGNALEHLQRHDEALLSYDKALELDPNIPYLHGHRLFAQMGIDLWLDLDNRVKAIVQALGRNVPASQPFPLLAVPVSNALLQRAAALYVADKFPPVASPLRHVECSRRERVRLGYFSADFHNHATAHLMAELFERHDRSRFEVFAFSFGPDRQDDVRARLVKAFDRFFDVADHSDQDIAALARQHEIDIAVDLKGFTQDCRPGIFALRPAPIQVNYLGFPGTMGAPYIDYILADPVVIPKEHFEFYSEKVVQLPHSYQVNDARRPIAETTPTRRELGLPETGFVFCCFNNNFKITPDVFAIWMRLLSRVEGSVLWLLEGHPSVRQNLRREAQQRNIDPARLVFAPRMLLAEHLARHRHADLFLDTFYCNAHTTASDALWAGLPLVTCLGDTFAGRVAASLLQAIGLPELITDSHEHYEALALRLASHPDELAAITHKLAQQRLSRPLFDTALFTRHIENAYAALWQRQQQGLPPDHMTMAP